MFCINNPHEKTKVVNSRTSKKAPVVWRRRQGIESGVTFTTYERPSLADNKPVTLPDGSQDIFTIGRLIISIAAAFAHDQHAARYDSQSIAQTVEDTLSCSNDALTPEAIARTTYTTLKRYDELAAVQYAAQHHLIGSIRRRGRPSFSENA